VVRNVGPRGVIARGLGRSYGDAAQNAGGAVLLPLTSRIELDVERGEVRASAGTTFHDLMSHLLPRGFFVPVTPGTRYVTLGGAIACDVHGKNHHRDGSLGNHVVELDLVTADGSVRRIGPEREAELYWATVGGMGLTGVIASAVLRLLRVDSGYMVVDTERLDDLDALMARMVEDEENHTYSVAWIDTLARGRSMGRSVLTSGEHADLADLTGAARQHPRAVPGDPKLVAPSMVPPRLISRPTVGAFNELWFRKAPIRRTGEIQSIAAFFHPLDGVEHWNRLYGRRGFLQYQFVVPEPDDGAMARILDRVSAAGHPSFLSILKRLGPGNPGNLSFPMRGWTLALDLPVGPGLSPLLDELDRSVIDAGGRVYLAKDSRLSAATLARMYPGLEAFGQIRAEVDPGNVFQSDLSRRLNL
jgi:decaprenylphospho-beta-D-ribofuranose 2-oxidase